MNEASLLLDLDGTLAPIVERPEDVGPDSRRNLLLQRLNDALEGRLAIISGRTIDDLDRILGASVPCLVGVHGLDRRMPHGRSGPPEPHPRLAGACLELEAFVGLRAGLHLEFKRLSVALHYRQAPGLGPEVLDFVRRLAWTSGLRLQEGQMVAELCSPGPDKGDSVRQLMAAAPFAGTRPIFLGDDVTDENGFAAARELGGLGVLVGAWRDTRANAGLADVVTVLGWIGLALDTGVFDLDVRL